MEVKGQENMFVFVCFYMQSESKAKWGVAKLYLPRSLTLTAIQEYKNDRRHTKKADISKGEDTEI